jgi:uncharacterized protein (TIGR02145 family)
MKTTNIFLALALLLSTFTFAQVGIGTTMPDSSAALDVKSSTLGFLPPRMTTLERDAINGGTWAEGLTIYNTNTKCLESYNGTDWISICDGSVTTTATCQNDVSVGTGTIVQMMYNYDGVYNTNEYSWCAREITQAIEDAAHADPAPLSGKTWLDRNLGAYQVATASTDAASYGDMYQWGRSMDGHAKRVQRTGNLAEEGGGAQGTMVNSTTPTPADTPTNALFITSAADWRSTSSNTLWTSSGGTNNPCPTGYYVPTSTQLQTLEDWLDYDLDRIARAVEDTELNMPAPGGRNSTTGSLDFVGSRPGYWSSSVIGVAYASYLTFDSSNSQLSVLGRAYGISVRCLKD